MPRGIYTRKIKCLDCGDIIFVKGGKTIRCRKCQKKCRDERRFDGMLEKVLKRDNYECQICGQKYKLNIHHMNRNTKDNSYWNLLTLCTSCHRMAHCGFL